MNRIRTHNRRWASVQPPGTTQVALGATESRPGVPDASSERHEAFTQRVYIPNFPSPKMFSALSANGSRHHWADIARWREMAGLWVSTAARVQGLKKIRGPVRLTFRWTFPQQRRRDIDNLIGNGVTKGAIDALVKGEWLVDDSSEHVVSVSATARVERGIRQLEIVIEPAE